MDGAYDKLCHDLSDPLPSHGDPPVVSAVINHKKLSGGQKDVNYHLRLHSHFSLLFQFKVSNLVFILLIPTDFYCLPFQLELRSTL